MVYAAPDDVAVRYPGELPAEERVLAFIEDAEVFLLGEVPDLAERITAGTTTTAAAKTVVTRLVLRRLTNPDEFKSEHDGDYGYSRDQSSWAVLTEADRRALGLGGTTGGVGMITLALAEERHR